VSSHRLKGATPAVVEEEFVGTDHPITYPATQSFTVKRRPVVEACGGATKPVELSISAIPELSTLIHFRIQIATSGAVGPSVTLTPYRQDVPSPLE